MQQDETVTVARVKTLLLVAAIDERDASIGEHAVAVEQQQLDARGASLDLFTFEHEIL